MNNIEIQTYSDIAPFERIDYSITSFEHKLYIFGGKSNGFYLGDIWSWDCNSLNWELLIVNMLARSNASIIIENNKIYIIGGYKVEQLNDINLIENKQISKSIKNNQILGTQKSFFYDNQLVILTNQNNNIDNNKILNYNEGILECYNVNFNLNSSAVKFNNSIIQISDSYIYKINLEILTKFQQVDYVCIPIPNDFNNIISYVPYQDNLLIFQKQILYQGIIQGNQSLFQSIVHHVDIQNKVHNINNNLYEFDHKFKVKLLQIKKFEQLKSINIIDIKFQYVDHINFNDLQQYHQNDNQNQTEDGQTIKIIYKNQNWNLSKIILAKYSQYFEHNFDVEFRINNEVQLSIIQSFFTKKLQCKKQKIWIDKLKQESDFLMCCVVSQIMDKLSISNNKILQNKNQNICAAEQSLKDRKKINQFINKLLDKENK